MLFDQAGSANQKRHRCRNRPIEAGSQRGGGGEIDQDVAMLIVQFEVRILRDGLLDGHTHSATRGEQGNADGLLVGAHRR